MTANVESVHWFNAALLLIQALTLLALVVYVWKTWEMAAATKQAAQASRLAAEEARDARLEALAPRIVVYFDSSSQGGAQAVIQNTGSGSAGNVKVTFDPPLQSSHETDTVKFFDKAQSIVPAGYTIRQTFDVWSSYFAKDLPREYTATAEYSGLENGRSYRHEFRLSIEALRNRVIRGEGLELDEFRRHAADTVRHLREIAEALPKLPPALAYGSGLARDLDEPAKALVSLWQGATTAETDSSLIRLSRIFIQTCRALALLALAEADRLPTGAKAALVEAAQILHRRDSEFLGRGRAWQDEATEAIARLDAALLARSQGYAPKHEEP